MNSPHLLWNRRQLLNRFGSGLGGVALAEMLAKSKLKPLVDLALTVVFWGRRIGNLRPRESFTCSCQEVLRTWIFMITNRF